MFNKSILHLENAVATPTIKNNDTKTFVGCIYDQTGQIEQASQRTKENVVWVPNDPENIGTSDIERTISGRSIYLGHLTSHYGHFLLETLSRFWALQPGEVYDNYVFHQFLHNIPDIETFSPIKVTFEAYGIDPKKVLIIDSPIRFENLTVPNSLISINNSGNIEQAVVYKHISDYCLKNYRKEENFFSKLFPSRLEKLLKAKKIYLSRSKFNSGKFVKNESDIENIFKSFGFTILSPELLNFVDQVLLFNNVEVLAGLNGSAMHNTLFMQKGRLAITIGDIRHQDKIHQNQEICNMLSGVKTAFINFLKKPDSNINNDDIDINHLKSELEKILA